MREKAIARASSKMDGGCTLSTIFGAKVSFEI
jgi:hypothetical protein